MNKRLDREKAEWRRISPQALGYFPRFALVILAFLLLLFLGWNLTGGGSVTQNQGIQAPPATSSADQPTVNPPVENNRPQTGTGGDLPANPPADQN